MNFICVYIVNTVYTMLIISHKPRLSVRMEAEALRLAGERAKAQGKTVGSWLEEAIREKLEREAKNE